jgi:protein TonB
MKKNLIITFSLITFISYGQDTIYYDYDWNKVSSIDKANYYEINKINLVANNKAKKIIHYKSGQIKLEKYYSVDNSKVIDGKLNEWYENGQLRKEIDYKAGKVNGNLLTYWTNGKPKRIDTFENDLLISGRCFDSDGKEIIHYDYEKIPEFPGGNSELMKYLVKELKYPKNSRKAEIEGLVLVEFIVNKYGDISDIKIVKSVNYELDEEAIRVVKKMPKWQPGIEDDEVVRRKFCLPIKYKLN